MVTIVDYGMGNLRSVQKAFERINVPALVTKNPADITKVHKILLPGVGHFKQGMKNLEETGFADAIKEAVIVNKKCILGICLGMQLLTQHSEEGNVNGLSLISGNTYRFPASHLKIPHMGWNSLNFRNNRSLLKGLDSEALFYFVHSYFVTCNEKINIASETFYGNIFVSSFQKDNIFGCQFHPEKSHDAGLQILKNFADL